MAASLWNRNNRPEFIDPSETEPIGNRPRSSDSDLLRLRKQVDRLTLTCQSMWELLRDHSELTEQDLQNKVAEVDLRDGSPDGRLASTVIVCGACGKNTNSRRDNCVWCGGHIDRQHIFEG